MRFVIAAIQCFLAFLLTVRIYVMICQDAVWKVALYVVLLVLVLAIGKVVSKI